MIKVKLGWEWMRFHFFANKLNRMFVANVEFRPFGIELYSGHTSVLIYLELVIGTLMIKLSK
jgi:hypothetical protein